MLLKPNMVISGRDCSAQASAEQVAEYTVNCFRHVVPAAVPGIVFLSGGQTARQATENLNAMNAMGPHPWQLSFSYGRALQEDALKTWKGNASHWVNAQKAFYHRASCVGAARFGKYSGDMEKLAA
jgi:fructose-bisphosphate aldolase class I